VYGIKSRKGLTRPEPPGRTVRQENRSKEGEGMEHSREEGRKEASKVEKEAIRKEIEKERRGDTEGTCSGLHHPATEDGKNSYSLREYGSLKDSNGWPKEWQC